MQNTYHVPAIHCNHCAMTIKVELSDMVGISAVDVDVDNKQVAVIFDVPADDSAIRTLLGEIGYPATD
jgi:copper chaperone CopZ